jgi:predicted  nucleic acid-binding Zn-ribbon protein
MKRLIFTKTVYKGANGMVSEIGKPFEIEDDKEAQGYIDAGVAELASDPTQEEAAAQAQAEADAKAAADADAKAAADAEAAAKAAAKTK